MSKDERGFYYALVGIMLASALIVFVATPLYNDAAYARLENPVTYHLG